MKAIPKPIVDHSLPVVALVGRPNVGKSTMFNRLTSSHFAIVEDQPGVTRDRRYGNCEYDGKQFRVVDTGGIDFTAEGSIAVGMRRQAEMAKLTIIQHVLLFFSCSESGLGFDTRKNWKVWQSKETRRMRNAQYYVHRLERLNDANNA